MNKQKNFFAIFLAVVMMAISCSQGNLEIVNIDENMPEAETTLTISINSVTSRTVRPEVVKWKVELFKNENERIAAANESKIWASRTLNAGNTSTTFTNIACAVYDVKISGYADKDCKKKVLFGECMVDMNDGENNLCVVNVEDYFADETTGGLNVTITGVSGLSKLLDNNNNGEQTVEFTLFPLKSTAATPKPEGDIIFLTYNEGTLTGQTEEPIPAGIYEMSGNCGDINLVQDPIVNIYADTTTDIYWEWDLQGGIVDKIEIEKELAETIIPVWTPQDENFPNYYYDMKKAGFLRGNALFAEPTWQDDLDFKNFCFDNAGDLWFLHSDFDGNKNEVFKISKVTDNEYNGISVEVTLGIESGNDEAGGSIIPDMSKCKFKDVAFVDGGILLLGKFEASFSLYYAPFDENEAELLICKQFDLNGFSVGGTVTSIAANGKEVYIATATKNEAASYFGADIYKGTISTDDNGEVTLDDFSLNSLLENNVLTIENFSADESVDNFSLDSPESFMISDMYIDDTALYFTAGCVVAKSNESSGIYYSFGGLFKYSEGQDEPLQSYGINTNTEYIHKNYQQSNYYLSSMQQAVSESDKYFAGPRYIIPHKSNGSELFVIDSGFYANIEVVGDTPPTEPIILNKRNRIFVFDTGTKDLSFTNVIDSVNFDFERMSEKDYSWNGS